MAATPPLLPSIGVIAAVAVGGSLGALARLGVFHAVHHHGRLHSHWTTLIVNVLGCLALGLILGWAAGKPLSETARALLTVGICGGFTTFSTFSGDALKLIQQHRAPEAALYTLASVLVGLAACWLGFTLLAPDRATITG